MPNGDERPISYASRTLTSAERGWSQIEKEAAAIVFGMKKFNQYLYGSHFKLVTDHRPLTTIFHPAKGLPPMTAARLQRWATFLMPYQYEIEYRPTKKHANCDTLSRLPLTTAVPDKCEVEEATEVSCVQQIILDDAPLDAKRVAVETATDPLLSRVMRHVREGWSKDGNREADMKPWWTRRDDLVVEKECLLWGSRVVVPARLQPQVLQMLHAAHTGIVKMKALARSHVWWPKMDAAIEEMVGRCQHCQTFRHMPQKAPLHPLEPTTKPWERIHIDFCGPTQGNRMWLIVVDSYSKWPEIVHMTSTTTKATIACVAFDVHSMGFAANADEW